MTDETELLAETAQQVMHRADSDSDSDSGGAWDAPTWQRLGDSGLSLVSVPESSAGSGGTLLDMLVVLREQGRAAARVPLAEAALGVGWLAGRAGIEVGTEPATAAAGDGLSVQRTSGGLRVSGVLERVPYGRICPSVWAVIQVGGEEVLVRLTGSDFAVDEGTNLAGEPRDTLRVEAAVADDQAWNLPGGSIHELSLRMALARAAMIVGAAEEAVRLSVSYAQGRVQFGKPLSSFQAIQHELAALTAEAVSSWVAVQAAAAQLDSRGGDGALAVTVAKAHCSEAAGRIARAAHQVHGAIGITSEHPLGVSTRGLWSWREEYGNEQAGWARIGSSIADAPDGIWQLATDGA